MVRRAGGRLYLAVLVITAGAIGAMAYVSTPAASSRSGDVRVLSRVPPPGQPEGIAIDPRDGSYWTGSNRADSAAILWHFSANGRLLKRYSVIRHQRSSPHAVNGILLDGRGRVYALDYSGARAVRLDPSTGRQKVYARFPDLPLCSMGRKPCEPSSTDRQAWPNWGVFDRHGNMYVTDLNQATIWKVAAGGGRARIWYQNAAFAADFSLNGIQFDAHGRLVFALTLSQRGATAGHGVIYRIGIRRNGSPRALRQIAITGAADGLAIGRGGRIYVALVLPPPDSGIQVVKPDGKLGNLLPPLSERRSLAIPLDSPASLAFRGTSLLVTNHAFITLNPKHFAILQIQVGERGLPLNYPKLAAH